MDYTTIKKFVATVESFFEFFVLTFCCGEVGGNCCEEAEEILEEEDDANVISEDVAVGGNVKPP